MTQSKIILLILLGFALSQENKFHPEAGLQFVEYVQHFGYPVQTHEIITDDGYRLKFFRIQAKSTDMKQGLQPVYLQHGLLDCSDTFVINDEDKALGFILANRGYDVWLGNSRGNKHSHSHVKFSDKEKAFWDFSFEDMAIHDLPSAFRYIHDISQQKIIYIGHSQGTIQMHVHLSLFPITQQTPVRKYLKQYIGLGPVAFVVDQQSVILNLLFKSGLDKVLIAFGVQEFMQGDTWLISNVGRVVCSIFPILCADIVTPIFSADKNLDNYERYDVLAGHDPAGTSTKNMLHWMQLIRSKRFQRYDYGDVMNLKLYGQMTPPEFNLDNIDIRVNYISGHQDLLADPRDVQRLIDNLKKSPKVWHRSYDADHCSFMWGRELQFLQDLFDLLDGKQ